MPPHARIRSLCLRSVYAAGLCLLVVFLMALSGAASITLLYDDPTFERGLHGFEGSVVRTVTDLRGLVAFIHGFGGYAAFVLAGWAAVEMFSLYRALRREGPLLRAFSGRMLVLGVIGSVLLACSIGILTITGVKAAGFNRGYATTDIDELHARVPGADRFASAEGDEMVNWHTRELTYLLGAAALLVAAATSQVRKVRTALSGSDNAAHGPDPS